MKLRHKAAGVMALLLHAAAAQAQQSAPTASAVAQARERIASVMAAASRADCRAVLATGIPLGASDTFNAMPAEQRNPVHVMIQRCWADGEAVGAVYRDARQATEASDGSGNAWQLRLAIEYSGRQYEMAVVSVETLGARSMEALSAMPMIWPMSLYADLKREDRGALLRRLLRVVARPDYVPVDTLESMDPLRLELASLLLADGDQAGARAQIGAMADVGVLSGILADPRMRRMLPDGFSLRNALERQLAQHRALMAQHPEMIQPLLLVAGDLRRLGRHEEALAILEPARARIEDPAAFADSAFQAKWWWDAVARAHLSLGHYDEMVASFRKGGEAREYGGINVSQTINLALAQNLFGRGRDALQTLTPFQTNAVAMSPYGAAQVRLARGCAHVLAGAPTEAEPDLRYLIEHEADDPGALTSLYLCRNELNGAALSFIRRLDNPDRRADALLQLSDDEGPAVPGSINPVRSRIPAVRARGDVQAAIARAGGMIALGIGLESF